MPVETRINIPFIPQEGITSQILSAIQLANERHVQQQQIQLQQQAQPSQIAQRQAETAKTQQEVSAGLPAAQAEAERSRAAYQTTLAQGESELNPIRKTLIQSQAREQNANASLAEARVALMKNPGNSDVAVDQTIDPKKYPELNKRVKAQVAAAQQFQAFDPEAPLKALSAGGAEVGMIERETDPSVIAARVQQAVTTQRMLYGTAPTGAVPPHLVAAATQEATKLGTDFATFSGQMKNLKSQLASAGTGDQVAAAFAPVAAALGSNAFYGTHRFSPTELQVLDSLGSVPRQIDAWFSKHATGALSEDSRKEFINLTNRLIDAKQSAYTDGLKVVNKNYGSKFEPLETGDSKLETPAEGGAKIPTYNPATGKLE